MAEGGAEEFEEIVKDTDYFHDLPCFPCEKDGRNVEGIKYCSDCKINLCTTCLTYHNKFPIMQEHTLLTNQGLTNPSQRCRKHGGKIIDVFCTEHDTVGCSTCISDEHSLCNDKKSIADVAAGIKTSQELKQLEAEMTSLISKLDVLKKLKKDNIQRLNREKDALKQDIQFTRKKMNDQLDIMEKDLLHEADTKFKQKIDANHTSIAEVDDVLARLKHAMDHVKSDNKEADIFVSCKTVKQEMSKEFYPLHAIIEEQHTERNLELHTDEYTKLIMEGKLMFCSIKDTYTIMEAEYKEAIRIMNDKKECRISAMCVLPDGCLVLAEYNYKKLKKLDTISNDVSTLIKLPDNPSGLCLVDNTCLAVSLVNQMKIQLVSLAGSVELEKSFSVGVRCRGVSHCDGLLYVCCGGSRYSKGGRGHVKVYNRVGEILRCFYEEFECPVFISVINNGYSTTMYTSDAVKGVYARGMDGVVKHRFPNYPNCTPALPFCLTSTGQICIGGRSNAILYSQNYRNKSVLVQSQGIYCCLLFDDVMSSRLFVAMMYGDTIKVFKLKE